jgi:hypothetical protein
LKMCPHRHARASTRMQLVHRSHRAFTGGNQFIKQRDVNYTSNARVNIFIFHRFFVGRPLMHLSHLGLRKLELPVFARHTKKSTKNNQKKMRGEDKK